MLLAFDILYNLKA